MKETAKLRRPLVISEQNRLVARLARHHGSLAVATIMHLRPVCSFCGRLVGAVFVAADVCACSGNEAAKNAEAKAILKIDFIPPPQLVRAKIDNLAGHNLAPN